MPRRKAVEIVELETGETVETVDLQQSEPIETVTSGPARDSSKVLISEKKYDKLLADLEKNIGTGLITSLDDADENCVEAIEFIPTGFEPLDWLLGGGIPRGRIIELYGLEGSGKSSLATQIIAAFQRNGFPAAYIDAEHAVDKEYLKKLGVLVNKRALLFSQPDNGEQALDIVTYLIKSGQVGVIVVDSVAALVPRAELEGDMETQQMGLQARMLGKGLRKISGIAAKAGVTVIFINQIREKLGIMFGDNKTTPGGKALKFFSSIRLEVTRKDTVKEKGVAVASNTRIKAAKNKVTIPFRSIEGVLRFGQGFVSFVKPGKE